MKTVAVCKLRFVPAVLLLAFTSCSGDKPADPLVPTTMVANSETSFTAVAGADVSPAPSVIVRDQNAEPLPGVTVAFSVTSGGGTVATASAVTDVSGVASAGGWTLGKTVGPNELTATSGTFSVSFAATGTVGATALLTISAGNNQTATSGSALPTLPAVLVQDANGNVKPGVTVTFAIGSGGGSIAGAAAVSNASGVATSGIWTLGPTSGPNTLVASATGAPSVTLNATGTTGAAASLTISAGNNQTALAGSAVPVPPAVIVKDANGNVKPGVTVTFAVGSGGGAVTGGTATSDAAGIARVGSWTLGLAGTNTLVASSSGAPSVTFTATATSKCGVATSHTLGTTSAGTLEANDCEFADGSHVDFFSITVPQANAYLFKQSAGFDTFLQLGLADGSLIASNDDESATSGNSSIKVLLPSGNFILGAGSFAAGVTGNYSLSSQTTSPENAACEVVFVTKGISTNQNIGSDCVWRDIPPAPPIYADVFYVFLHAGQSITVDMSSSSVDSYLELRNDLDLPNGTLVAQNDNRDGTTNNARITFTATVEDYYAIVARTAVGLQTGAYTLNIQ